MTLNPESDTIDSVLFLGLGAMGFPMASRLLDAGVGVHVLSGHAQGNTSALQSKGAVAHASFEEIPSVVRVAILMLPSGDACHDAVHNLLSTDSGIETIVDCSTISPADAQTLDESCREKCVTYLDAPVSGGVQGAEAGRLTLMVGGDQEALGHVQALLSPMATSVFYLGGSGSGQVIKACNNLVGATTMLVSSLSLVIAERFGITSDSAREVIQAGTGANWQLENHLPMKAMAGDYEPGFAVSLLLKDLNIAHDMMRGVGMEEAPSVDGVIDAYSRTVRKYGGDVDFSSVKRIFDDVNRNGD